MTGWSPRRDSRWEFNEHVFLLRRLSKPTDQHKEECEKVGSQSQCQSWCVFFFFGGGGGQRDRVISSVTTGDELNYSCRLSVCFSISFYQSEALEETPECRDVGRTLARMNLEQSGFKVKGTLVKAFCLQVSMAYRAREASRQSEVKEHSGSTVTRSHIDAWLRLQRLSSQAACLVILNLNIVFCMFKHPLSGLEIKQHKEVFVWRDVDKRSECSCPGKSVRSCACGMLMCLQFKT